MSSLASIKPNQKTLIKESIDMAKSSSSAIDIEALSAKMGVKVEKKALERISGRLYKDNKTWVVEYNSSEAVQRQRFTIAHELAHFLLHSDKVDDDGVTDDIFYRSSLSDDQEVEANKAAAELLMPWELINHFMSKGIKTPKGLADKLNVSLTAMNIRLGLPT